MAQGLGVLTKEVLWVVTLIIYVFIATKVLGAGWRRKDGETEGLPSREGD
jgi:hypothetical protein